MAKLAVFFLVIFVIVQLTLCDEAEVEDTNAETTTGASLLETLQKGFEKGLSPENIDKFKTNIGTFTDSVTDLGNKLGENVKKFFDKVTSTVAPDAAVPDAA
ncbi:uncharacterized protein [Chironomus tepperi]|uniref:uncharacterized protein n=1 Tax=Chironomus tepperi TaxID=113505 RepID=UPI00391F2157